MPKCVLSHHRHAALADGNQPQRADGPFRVHHSGRYAADNRPRLPLLLRCDTSFGDGRRIGWSDSSCANSATAWIRRSILELETEQRRHPRGSAFAIDLVHFRNHRSRLNSFHVQNPATDCRVDLLVLPMPLSERGIDNRHGCEIVSHSSMAANNVASR